MEKHQLDAITGLTMGPGCAIDPMYGDRYSNDFLTGPAAMAGYPHISVPAGQVYGLPVGLSIFGAPYTEHELIKMAFSYEQATKHRAKPGFLQELAG
jgi:amidase